jgi:hypothetical protein
MKTFHICIATSALPEGLLVIRTVDLAVVLTLPKRESATTALLVLVNLQRV